MKKILIRLLVVQLNVNIRWEDNIKMDFQEVGWGMNWIKWISQDWNKWRALVSAVMNL